MSLFDKAKAAAKLTKRTANRNVRKLAEGIDSKFQQDEWYQTAKESTKEVLEDSQKVATRIKKKGEDLTVQFGETKVGSNIGKKARTIAGVISSLPVFSITSDVMKVRHGVIELHEKFTQYPNDPTKAVWLAEALGRVQKDMAVYSRIRSVTDPSYAVIRQSVITTTKLGQELTDPTYIRLLKHAFSISIKRTRHNPRDDEALHVLSRIYLAQNELGEATRFAKLAIMAKPDNGLPWVTLSRAYVAIGQTENARRAALKAIDDGIGYGNEILAEALLLSSISANLTDIESYHEMRSSVSKKDRSRYLGTDAEGVSVLEGIGKEQLKKLQNIFN